MLMSFKKDTASPVKKYKDFFKSLDHTVDRVYSYGFSYSPVDKIYIKMIIERIIYNVLAIILAIYIIKKYDFPSRTKG